MAQALPAVTQPARDSSQSERTTQPGKVLPMEPARKEKAGEKNADVAIEVLGLFFM